MSTYQHCATARGVEEHIRDGESCRICKEWLAAGGSVTVDKPKPKRNPKRKTAPKKPATTATRRTVAKCGTIGGLRKHYRDGTVTCEECLKVGREYQRQVRVRNGAKRQNVKEREHGTMIGVGQHVRAKEPLCQPCKDARNAYQRARRAAGLAA